MVIPFRGLSLQEDCHTFLYPSVGMLLGTSHKLHSGGVVRPASSLSIDLPADMEFCDWEVIWTSYRGTCAA